MTGIRTHIFIGSLEILRTPRAWVEFKRHAPLSRAGITLPDPKGEYFRSITHGDPVEIRLGYRDQAPDSWRGKVEWVNQINKDQIEIGAVGLEYPFSETKITESWENETPEAIVRYVVGKTGLPVGTIYSTGVVFPRFVASSIPVWQVARQAEHTCQRAFGLDMSGWALWMDKDGKVNWGNFDESGDIPIIATGNGLIRHLPATDGLALNMVETFLISGFRASRKFRLKDTKRGIDAEFRALTARHEVTPNSVRTFIQYGTEHEKF